MPAASEFIHQASKFRTILSNADDSEILAHADELLLFLNRLQDFLRHSLQAQIPISSINDIIYGLESNPEVTLQDKSFRARLLNLFMKL
ncbi:MAG: hypothetical protein ABR936_12735 [Bacteroidota bacterium]|jgi:hypothetical protein